MCGISGILGGQIEAKDKVVRGMTAAILHRGPDEDGYHVAENVALGMRRLSIIDLAGGHQPISTEDERYTIVFNGEIYNYKELKQELVKKGCKFQTESDTEVVLKMFELYGPKSFERLRGMFAFAIHDSEKSKVTLVRDFFGIKPLYYLTKGERIVAFSSEIKSFFSYPGFKPEVNDSAVYNYLSYQYNPLEETFFQNVYKLPPAHYMSIDLEGGKVRMAKYWQAEFKEDESLDEEETRKKILQTMEDSVAHHMIADVPVGSFLSGGIDSSIIATLMQRILNGEKTRLASTSERESRRVKTFTVTFGSVTEGKEAKETAEPLSTDHKEVSIGSKEYFDAIPKVVWHFDEPVADPSALGLYFLAREARKEVKVVLSGEGADELFGGYNIYLEPFSRSKISWIPRPILKWIVKSPIKFRGQNYASRALQTTEERYIGNAKVFNQTEADRLWRGGEIERFDTASLYGEVSHLADSTKMQYIDINTWLVGDILAKADKMTMAHSLELRVPFLDIEVAKLALTLPAKFKWQGRTTKYLLREAFKSVLPESTRNRRKLGFPTPLRSWFTADAKDAYATILKNPYIKEKFDTIYIQDLIAAHVRGKADNSRKIYLLLMLAVWYNSYITRRD